MNDPLAPRSRRRVPVGVWVALAVAALVVHLPAVSPTPADPAEVALRAEAARADLADVLTGPFGGVYAPVHGLVRAAEHALIPAGGKGPSLVVWALFAAVVAAAGAVLPRAVGAYAAIVAALLLAVHPVHVESVAGAHGLDVLLAVAAAGAAFVASRRARARGGARLAPAPAAWTALAGLAHPTGFALAFVVAADEAADPDAPPGRLVRLLPLLLVGATGLVVAVAGASAVGGDGATLAALADAHGRGLLSLVAPVGLAPDYPADPATSFASPVAWLGAAAALVAVVVAIVGVRRRRPALALGGALWVAGSLAAALLPPRAPALRSDAGMLLPALGAYLVAAHALALAVRSPVVRVAAPAVAAAVLAVLGSARAAAFASPTALWDDADRAQPASAVVALERARLASAAGRLDVAASAAREAARRADALDRPELASQAFALVARTAAELRRPDEALEAAVDAVRRAERAGRSAWAPKGPAALRADAEVATALAIEARFAASADRRATVEDVLAAEKAWRRAVAADPRDAEAAAGLGRLLAARGGEARLAEATESLRRAVALAPDDVATVAYLVRVLVRSGRDTEAKALYDATSRRLGAPRVLRLADARLAVEIGTPDDAERKLAALLAEDPADPEARALRLVLRRRVAREALAAAQLSRDPADMRRAVEAFDRAAEAAPGDPELAVGAGDALLALNRFLDARRRYAHARTLAGGAPWIAVLEARAGVLEACALDALGQGAEAARSMAEVVRAAPPRIDLGYAELEAETERLRPAADAVLGPASQDLPAAQALLRGAALFVGGDEKGARAALEASRSTYGAPPPAGSRAAAVHDAATLLLGIATVRRADVAGARALLAPLQARRPDDPLVAYHLLLVDRLEASARRRIAEGSGDEAGAAAARAALEAATRGAVALATRTDVTWPGPGLLAAELDLERGDQPAALRRLNELTARFPGAPSVARGVAAVYQVQALESPNRQRLLEQARKALLDARALDPRDPRVAFDLSQLYMLAGDLETARVHGLVAAAAEPIPGPATRRLCAILVEQGRRAIEARDLDRARELAATARRLDGGAAEAELLAGEVALAKQDLDGALTAFLAAQEKAPADPKAVHALADCRRRRGNAYFLWRQRYPRPKASAGKEPDPAAVAEWERTHLAALRMAVHELEESVRLEPDAAEADASRESIARLRALDPDAVATDAQAARRAYEEGETLRRADRRVDALARYRDAVSSWPEHFPAWMRIAEMSVVLGADHDAEGIRAVERLRALDPERRYPEPDFYAGEIWARMARAAAGDARRAASAASLAAKAREALERFLRAVDATSERGAENAARARVLLDGLPGAK